jgi:hypothetical protein
MSETASVAAKKHQAAKISGILAARTGKTVSVMQMHHKTTSHQKTNFRSDIKNLLSNLGEPSLPTSTPMMPEPDFLVTKEAKP